MSTAEWVRPVENVLAPRAKRRPARPRAAERDAANEPALAGFMALEVGAIDAEKWPVSPVVWWQPELAFEPPTTSGLRNERKYKAPVAGFLSLDSVPVLPPGVAATPEALVPEFSVRIPQSDLTPSGRGPRGNGGKGSE